MSKQYRLGEEPDVKIHWIELDCRIFCGAHNGFSETIFLDAHVLRPADSVLATAYWHGEDYWGFEFERGEIAIVSDNRVRYIKGSATRAVETETKSDDVVHVEKGLQERTDNDVHSDIVAPKRRGRPPKVKPE